MENWKNEGGSGTAGRALTMRVDLNELIGIVSLLALLLPPFPAF
jgi:hypothetical protein